MSIESIIIPLFTALGTGGLVYLVLAKYNFLVKPKGDVPKKETKVQAKAAEPSPEVINTLQTAKDKARQIELDAKSEALKIREEAEKESQSIRDKALDVEKKAERRLDDLFNKQKQAEQKEEHFSKLQQKWQKKNSEVDNLRQEQIDKLQNISALTREEAKQQILSNLEKTLENDVIRKIKEAEERYQSESDKKAKEILVDAMHHAATDYVAEYTMSTIKLPDESMKGRIIGKEGRNIRAFEDATGINVDFENEDEVRLSSFDAVRREVARRSLEVLMKDGRIHPARIEEVVGKVEKDVDKIILEAGEALCDSVGVYNLPKELVKKLGNFKFRTSYGQNMIQHTLEETQIGAKLAGEIGANVPITKLACLLHDIGKVITDKEGNHIELGADYLKKFNIPQAVITAVSEHHDDKPSTAEGVIVQIADSISGSRPGARYEDYENFVKRMHALEDAALSFDGVDKAFAISAGREVRVIVKPDEVNDTQAAKLSYDIAEKIENEQTFPGTVKVIVIRELRTASTAS